MIGLLIFLGVLLLTIITILVFKGHFGNLPEEVVTKMNRDKKLEDLNI